VEKMVKRNWLQKIQQKDAYEKCCRKMPREETATMKALKKTTSQRFAKRWPQKNGLRWLQKNQQHVAAEKS